MRIFLLLLFFCSPLAALSLNQQLQNAQDGDYLVTYQNRTYTLLLVKENRGDTISFEEISIPKRRGGGGLPKSWSQWLHQGAPNNTSWIAYTVDVQSGRVTKTYSYTQKGWLRGAPQEQFLPTLLRLDFKQIPASQRRRTGRGGQIWNPPLAFHGQRCQASFNAYCATWPQDGSPVAGKQVTIYLPAQAGAYPDYFPYWIEVNPVPIDQKIRVIDSGRNLVSPRPALN